MVTLLPLQRPWRDLLGILIIKIWWGYWKEPPKKLLLQQFVKIVISLFRPIALEASAVWSTSLGFISCSVSLFTPLFLGCGVVICPMQCNCHAIDTELGQTSQAKGTGRQKTSLISDISYKQGRGRFQDIHNSDQLAAKLEIATTHSNWIHSFARITHYSGKSCSYNYSFIIKDVNQDQPKKESLRVRFRRTRDTQLLVPQDKSPSWHINVYHYLGRFTWASVAKVFIRVSLWTHDWLNLWPHYWVQPLASLSSQKAGLIAHASKPNPRITQLFLLAWWAPSWVISTA